MIVLVVVMKGALSGTFGRWPATAHSAAAGGGGGGSGSAPRSVARAARCSLPATCPCVLPLSSCPLDRVRSSSEAGQMPCCAPTGALRAQGCAVIWSGAPPFFAASPLPPSLHRSSAPRRATLLRVIRVGIIAVRVRVGVAVRARAAAAAAVVAAAAAAAAAAALVVAALLARGLGALVLLLLAARRGPEARRHGCWWCLEAGCCVLLLP